MASRGRAAGCPSHQAQNLAQLPSPALCKQTLWNSFLGAPLPVGVYRPVQGGWLVGVCLPASRSGEGGQVFDWVRVSGARGSNAVCLGVWWLVCEIASLSARAELVLDSVRRPPPSPRGQFSTRLRSARSRRLRDPGQRGPSFPGSQAVSSSSFTARPGDSPCNYAGPGRQD